MPRKKKEKYETCFSRLKLNNMGAVDGIISQTAKTAEIKYLQGKKEQTRLYLTFLEVSK